MKKKEVRERGERETNGKASVEDIRKGGKMGDLRSLKRGRKIVSGESLREGCHF